MRRTCFCIWLLACPALAVDMDMVRVTNPGNLSDTRHETPGFGAVDYEFAIGKYEITNGQYRDFLNHKATVNDPHGLYNVELVGWGIDRIGAGTDADPWVYFPTDGKADFDELPVAFVGVWDSARFANWLHNGQGDGDTETGAYVGIDDELAFERQAGARYFLPTEDEWYKAAYFDPQHPNGPNYWEYPTRSDTLPSNEPPPGTDLVNGSATFGVPTVTPVGAFAAKPSTGPFGTYDMGGNLWEWNETIVMDGLYGLRGGSFDNIFGLEAAHQDSYPADLENRIMGFRLASPVPEPHGCRLVLLAISACLVLRRA